MTEMMMSLESVSSQQGQPGPNNGNVNRDDDYRKRILLSKTINFITCITALDPVFVVFLISTLFSIFLHNAAFTSKATWYVL